MSKGLFALEHEQMEVREAPGSELGPGQVRVRTRLAAIKHGTTFHLFSGQSPFHERRMFVAREPGAASGDLANSFVGNMITGTVEALGAEVQGLREGDRVFGYGAACETVTMLETGAERLPDGMSETDAVCMDPALFALAAVRDGRIGVGDHVAVFGLGAIGLFVVQLLKLNGCLQIAAIDPFPLRRDLALRFGATLALNPLECDVGAELRQAWGAGADVVLEASGHYAALNQAFRAARQCGRVVTLGYYKGKGTELELGAEWLHNRLDMVCSLPDWNNPSREYPQWDRARLWRTLKELFCRKALVSDGIVDPIVPLSEAPRAFLEIYCQARPSVKLGIRFDLGEA